jgi:hypothetical protein
MEPALIPEISQIFDNNDKKKSVISSSEQDCALITANSDNNLNESLNDKVVRLKNEYEKEF